MERARFDAIVRRPDEERDRDGFPSGLSEPHRRASGALRRPGIPGAREDARVRAVLALRRARGPVARRRRLPACSTRSTGSATRSSCCAVGTAGSARSTTPVATAAGRWWTRRAAPPASARLQVPRMDLRPRRAARRVSRRRRTSRATRSPSVRGLRQVECDTWGPLVFVKLSAAVRRSREHLEPIATELDALLGDEALGVALRWREAASTSPATGRRPATATSRPTTSPSCTGTAPRRCSTRAAPGSGCCRSGHSRMLIRFRSELPRRAPPAPLPGRHVARRARDLLVPRLPEPEHRVRRSELRRS